MSRWLSVVLCSMAAAGCGGDSDPPPDLSPSGSGGVSAVETPVAQSPAAQTTIRGMKLEMHYSSDTRGGLRKPVFTATMEEATAEAGNAYTAKGITARAEREGDSPITFKAADGFIDQENNTAKLWGGVRLERGNIVMDLEDVTWDNKSGTARSEHKLTFGDGTAALTASGMVLRTEDNSYTLRNPRGRIRLGRQGESM